MGTTVSMKDVAREAGVSVMTVSRAFRANSSIGEETRKHVLEVSRRMGYVMDASASSLRAKQTAFVAALVPSLNNANFADTIAGLTEETEAQGLQLLLGATGYRIDREAALIADLLRHRPQAMVLTGGSHTDEARHLLETAEIPVIETWDLPARPLGHFVGFSNARCMDPLVDHLVERGYRRIAFIGGDSATDTRGGDRRQGFLAALDRHGLDRDRLIGAGQAPISMSEGAGAMGALLDRLPDTEAVICVSDVAAFGALTECQRRGMTVPDDIAIAGFGYYEIARVCLPTITTVDPSPVDIGREAGRIVSRLLKEKSLPPQTHTITSRLVIGGTT